MQEIPAKETDLVNERKRTSFHLTACTAETEQAGATLVSDSKVGVPGVPGVAGGPGASEAVVRLIQAKWQD